MKSHFAFVMLIVITLAAARTSSYADQPSTNVSDVPASNGDESLFCGNELSVDLFGTVSVGQDILNHASFTRVRDNGRLGAGAGLNYFITKYVGVGGDAYSESTSGRFVDDASGNFIVRIPLDAVHLAPYVYGGGGYQFDFAERAFGQVGVGLECRFTRCFGLFVDGRYVMMDGHFSNFGLGRAGLRFSF